ncbi:hypothetical protein H7097_01170 [Aeromicrobium sp.]|nr:hypothetical protein [Candidatus Saccharibacteria bacterium]
MADCEILNADNALTTEQRLETAQFVAQHVNTPTELQATYQNRTITDWADRYETKRRPMWLRRTFDMGSEFGAVVGYCSVVHSQGQRVYGSIMFDREVEVVLPSSDQPKSGEVTSRRPYLFEAISLAIAEVEAAFAMKE